MDKFREIATRVAGQRALEYDCFVDFVACVMDEMPPCFLPNEDAYEVMIEVYRRRLN